MWNKTKFDQAAKNLPALYSTEKTKLEDKNIQMHLFMGSADWYIAEADLKEGLLWGFACLGDWQNAEWGYMSIEEMQAIRVHGVEVDYDLHWKACRFADIPKAKENLYI